MQSNGYLSTLTTSLALSIVATAQAAEPVLLQQQSFKTIQLQFQLALPGMAQTSAISPNTLYFIQQRTDKNHTTHIRMQQQYLGFEVYGGYAIMHSKNTANQLLAAQDNVWMNGMLYSGLQAELGQPTADFVKNASLALQQFKVQYAGKELSEEQVTLIVYIDGNHQAHWAYRVSVYIRHDHQIPERPTAIIDAQTYQPFIQWNDIKTALRISVKGTGYGGNPKTGKYLFGKGYPLLDITYDRLTKNCYMQNNAVKVVDMKHAYFSLNGAMKFKCRESQDKNPLTFWTGYKGDGYDEKNEAFSPTNDALYSGYVIKHMYHDWYDVEVLSKRGKPMLLIMRVHYGEGYENAYWDGKQMTFGDGATSLYPLVSLGIGAHEISHGFTEQHSNLTYRAHSGGLNESFSDMAAQAAELYSTGKNTWLIGAEIIKKENGVEALRYMDRPSRDGQSIDSADQYYDGLDVHFSSGVFNRLFYLISTTPNWDSRKAFDVMVKANMDYWIPNTTFDEAGCGVLHATRDLGFSVGEVKKSLDAVAVNYHSCGANIS